MDIPVSGIIALIALALVVVLLAQGLVMVHQRRTMVIERLGKFHRVLEPGLRFIIPFIDQPRAISILRFKGDEPFVTQERLIDMREIVLDFPAQSVITKDNVNTQVDGVLYYQILDPQASVYGTENLVLAIQTLAQTSLRSEIGTMELDKIFESRQDINDRLRATMDEAGDKWGVKVNRVEIRDISVPNEIREAMNQQMVAERNRRAKVREAEGYRESEILQAEGDKQAAILQAQGERDAAIANAEGDKQAAVLVAEGEAEAIRKIVDSMGGQASAQQAVQYLVAQKYIEMLPDMAKNGDRVFIPAETSSLMGSVGGIQELLRSVPAAAAR
ncbi:SPFH domain-containing protein [Aquisalimonas asiatica]|uniref:SPFH domain, Band 7 family protein n=1 Tax=Aquisalimonas asiatica TaxID=406100 RepID=A0A1H8V6X7_9GAMM|nr:stomatin-like protein [Aquisalimonas asiatica]SEP11121.1 SPFH domain, Band 7 family protein [Aquisalimonas asiatica]